jgi:hypothetical protein
MVNLDCFLSKLISYWTRLLKQEKNQNAHIYPIKLCITFSEMKMPSMSTIVLCFIYKIFLNNIVLVEHLETKHRSFSRIEAYGAEISYCLTILTGNGFSQHLIQYTVLNLRM